MDRQHFWIETPEQIAVEYTVAGIGGRFVAACLDHFLIGVLAALFGSVAVRLLVNGSGQGSLEAGLFGTSLYLILCAYYIVFETLWNGRTPGKRLVGLRVIQRGGQPVGFFDSAVRNIVRLVDFVPVLYGFGVVCMFADRQGRRLGDFAAGTITVKENVRYALTELDRPVVHVEGPIADLLTIPALDRLTSEDYEMVQLFFSRRRALTPQARVRLATMLVGGMEQRLGYRIVGDAETFLQRCVAEYHALHGVEQAAQAVLTGARDAA
ncbi:MAG: RDD family protein [Herpetosiphon sp.]